MVNNSPQAGSGNKESEKFDRLLDKIALYQRERIMALLKERQELLEERKRLRLYKLLLLLVSRNS